MLNAYFCFVLIILNRMKSYIFISVILIFLIIFNLFSEGNKSAKLTVNITNIKNDTGFIYLALINNESAFLKASDSNALKFKSEIRDNKASFVIDSILYGTYAAVCFHDQNLDGELNRNFFGLPAEGWGISNNPDVKFGPPGWKECKFDILSDSLRIDIIMKYQKF